MKIDWSLPCKSSSHDSTWHPLSVAVGHIATSRCAWRWWFTIRFGEQQ